VNERFQDDRQVIQQNLMAIAEMQRARAHSLAVLDQSMQLLRIIDRINSPFIDASSGEKQSPASRRNDAASHHETTRTLRREPC
jgi:hypothetical protein